jgi:hypothetical protein
VRRASEKADFVSTLLNPSSGIMNPIIKEVNVHPTEKITTTKTALNKAEVKLASI